jgi:formylmethanofuran dehydrogenase subunit D
MPGHGRARIESSLLTKLGIADNEEVEVVTTTGSSLVLTIFADSLVEKNQIRISEEDLKKLGIDSGTQVVVRRKVPVTEQVKAAAHDISDRAMKGIKGIEGTVSEKTSDLKEGAIQVSRDIQDKGREVTNKIVEEVGPIGEKISEAGRETAARIADLVPTARFNAVVETSIKRLKPVDASELKKILLQNDGDIRAITITSPTVAGRTIQNLTVPPDVIIAAIQRVDNSLSIAAPELVLSSGDIVYIIGKAGSLDLLEGILEG